MLKSNLADATLISQLITAFPHHLRTPTSNTFLQFLQNESQFRPCPLRHWRRHLHRFVVLKPNQMKGLVSDREIFYLQATTPSTQRSHSSNTRKNTLVSPRYLRVPRSLSRTPSPQPQLALSKIASRQLSYDDVALEAAFRRCKPANGLLHML